MQKGIKKRSGHMPILDTLHLPPGTLEIFFDVFQFGRVSAHIFKIIDYCIKTLLDRLDYYVFSTSVKRGDDVVCIRFRISGDRYVPVLGSQATACAAQHLCRRCILDITHKNPGGYRDCRTAVLVGLLI